MLLLFPEFIEFIIEFIKINFGKGKKLLWIINLLLCYCFLSIIIIKKKRRLKMGEGNRIFLIRMLFPLASHCNVGGG